jgi:topoisomerase-4 subunit A
MKVVKVSEKTFIGKDILHVAVFQKNDERTTYNLFTQMEKQELVMQTF